MNLPNRLTVLRILLIPFFTLFLLWDTLQGSIVIALLLFLIASVTDFLDGYIARRRGLITDFGKLLDPMADKLLVLCAMICLNAYEWCSTASLLIVVSREIIVSAVRLVAASQNVVLAASRSGKVKTAVQMASITAILTMGALDQLALTHPPLYDASRLLMGVSTAITAYSGIEFLWRNRRVIPSWRAR